jgi:hypothetical protein
MTISILTFEVLRVSSGKTSPENMQRIEETASTSVNEAKIALDNLAYYMSQSKTSLEDILADLERTKSAVFAEYYGSAESPAS